MIICWPGAIYLPLPEELEEGVDLLGVALVQGEQGAAAAPAAGAGGAVGGGHALLAADMAAGPPCRDGEYSTGKRLLLAHFFFSL